MTIDDTITDKKLQYDIKGEATKTSALSAARIDKYEYLKGEEILPYNKKQITKQSTFNYSLLEKASGKQAKTIKDQGDKQIEARWL